VRVPTLRDASAGLADLGDRVALDDHDFSVSIGQHSCGKQAGHASAQNDCAFTQD